MTMRGLIEARVVARIELRIEELEAELRNRWKGSLEAKRLNARISEAKHIIAILRALEGGGYE